MITPALLALALASSSGPPIADAKAAEVVAHIDPSRARQSVDTLAAFGTRHTLSDTTSETRGIGAARRWLKAELEKAGIETTFEEFQAPKMQRMPEGGAVVNVVGVLKGSQPWAEARRYYVVGHYDSFNAERLDFTNDAPGANDDASGTTVVLECARALAKARPESTIVFLCTAGEEQGLVGAKFHAETARARGDLILGVLNNDIVGDPSPRFEIPPGANAPDQRSFVRVFSEAIPKNPSAEELARIRQLGAESDSTSRQLARFVVYVGEREKLALRPMMVFRQDRFLRGGDHSAFNDAGFGAVRFTVPGEDYSRQHQNVTTRDGKPYGDLASFVDADYVAGVARLNAATLLHLANAPRPPENVRLVTAELTTATTVRWEACKEPDVAGYEVAWRWTTSPDWDGVLDAGMATELKLGLSKDNYFFGVRAYDKDGYRSPVTFAGAAKE
jgi:Zn-dependent M28 family amino/carboxypeptidase